jgi:hypothetical protein
MQATIRITIITMSNASTKLSPRAETNSGPDSAHRPAKPPPPSHAIHAIASNQKTNEATKKASFDLENNNRMLVAISNDETAQNDAAEADGALLNLAMASRA